MLGYFRINDPYRLVIIFVLLLLFRLPYLISSDWVTIPELRWMIVGERMNEGALLYVDIWDDISLLSALVYKGIDFVFGRSVRALQVLGLILFYFQIFYMNYIALKHKMYHENNYLPALFFGLLGLISFNMITLSPILMGLTFIMLSIDSLLTHVETRNKTDANLINIGLFTGIAALFFLPFVNAVIIHAIILLFFTNTLKRRYLLMVYGLFVPMAIAWLYYVWKGNAAGFYNNFLLSLFRFEADSFLSLNTILVLSGFTVFLYLISAFKILSGLGFNIFQVRIQKTMFFASVISFLIWLLYSDKAGYGFVMFLPWFSFFLTHFFLSIRHSLKRELSFLIYFLSVIIIYFGLRFQLFGLDHLVEHSSITIKQDTDYLPPYYDKKILVIGPDIRPYFYGRQATPYFNWELSKSQVEGLNFYDNLEAINRNIRNDMPEFIIDQVNIVPELFDKIPLLGNEFDPAGNGIYKKR